eukprot:m51a1_g2198 putative 5 -3 exoribonuclease 2 (865) ;mRNA; r:140646-143739
MGVPSFFRWLASKFPQSVRLAQTEGQPGEPVDATRPNPNGVEYDNLYFDLNGVIHPCCHPDGCEAPPTEELMVEEIFKVVDHIFNIVRPRKLLYIAIDGVAPRAKMNQQRSRRFRAVRDAKERAEAEAAARQELGMPPKPPKEHWDTNAITPGTPFMEKVAAGMRHYIATRIEGNPAWKGVKVVFSSSSSPGEGEHKIVDYIRKQRNQPGYDPQTHHVVYGLDADLIMLALASHEPRFTLVREDRPNPPRYERHFCKTCQKFGHSTPNCPTQTANKNGMAGLQYILLDIAVVREFLDQLLRCEVPFGYDLERIIDDFVCLCVFAGNDFLPHVPTLSIHDGGLDALLMAYRCALPKLGGYMTSDGRLSIRRLQRVLRDVAAYEDHMVSFRRKGLRHEQLQSKTPSWMTSSATGEIPHILERGEALESRPWHEAYYEQKFGTERSPRVASDLALAFLQGVWWTMRYYTQGCPSWTWYYPYYYAPFVCDLADAVDPDEFTRSVKAIPAGAPFRPVQQLLAVLPPASCKCLPEAVRPLMFPGSPIADFYPEEYGLDMNDEAMEWKAITLLPWIDEARLLAAASEREPLMSAEEQARNTNSLRDLLYARGGTPIGALIAEVNRLQRAGFARKLAVDRHGVAGTVALVHESLALDASAEPAWPSLGKVGPAPEHVVVGAFKSPKYAENYLFESKLLPGVVLPPPVLVTDIRDQLWFLTRPKCLGAAMPVAQKGLTDQGVVPKPPSQSSGLGGYALDAILRGGRAGGRGGRGGRNGPPPHRGAYAARNQPPPRYVAPKAAAEAAAGGRRVPRIAGSAPTATTTQGVKRQRDEVDAAQAEAAEEALYSAFGDDAELGDEAAEGTPAQKKQKC